MQKAWGLQAGGIDPRNHLSPANIGRVGRRAGAAHPVGAAVGSCRGAKQKHSVTLYPIERRDYGPYIDAALSSTRQRGKQRSPKARR